MSQQFVDVKHKIDDNDQKLIILRLRESIKANQQLLSTQFSHLFEAN